MRDQDTFDRWVMSLPHSRLQTAFPEARIRARVLRAGACGFLSKPFNDESLIKCLDTALAA
jgi:FixJ family two-component response regulator